MEFEVLEIALDSFPFLMVRCHWNTFVFWGEILYISVLQLVSLFNYVISLMSDLLLVANKKYIRYSNLLGE